MTRSYKYRQKACLLWPGDIAHSSPADPIALATTGMSKLIHHAPLFGNGSEMFLLQTARIAHCGAPLQGFDETVQNPPPHGLSSNDVAANVRYMKNAPSINLGPESVKIFWRHRHRAQKAFITFSSLGFGAVPRSIARDKNEKDWN